MLTNPNVDHNLFPLDKTHQRVAFVSKGSALISRCGSFIQPAAIETSYTHFSPGVFSAPCYVTHSEVKRDLDDYSKLSTKKTYNQYATSLKPPDCSQTHWLNKPHQNPTVTNSCLREKSDWISEIQKRSSVTSSMIHNSVFNCVVERDAPEKKQTIAFLGFSHM